MRAKIITLILATVSSSCLFISGCQIAYRPTIQQGKVIKPAQVNSIRRGMSRNQVIALLGQPVRDNVFAPNKLIYTYTIQPNHSDMREKLLIVTFTNNRVSQIKSSGY